MAFINDKEVFFSPHLHVSEVANVRTYSDVEIYNRHDIVSYNGTLYTPTVDSVTGKAPTDTEFWEDLASSKVNREELGATLSDLEAEVDVAKEEIARLEKENEIFEKRITNLEGATLEFTEDSSSAYCKIVPTNAAKYASVNKVGGMTYKCNNKIPFPYTYMSTHGANGTKEGITFATADDGTITLNGTATRDVAFELYRAENICKADGAYYLSGVFATGSLSTFFMALQQRDESDAYLDGVNVLDATSKGSINLNTDATLTRIYIHIFAGATVTNAVFKPMLNEGSTALPYEPFFEGLRDTKVTELVSEGAQVIPYPYSEAFSTKNGLTFAKSGDGVSVSGTASAFTTFYLMRKTAQASTYTLSCDALTSGVAVVASRYKAKAGGGFEWISNICDVRNTRQSITFEWTEEESKMYTLGVHIGIEGQAIVNLVVYPMLNRGTTAAPYKPYRTDAVDRFPISAELRSFLEQHGYGRGVEGYEGYIDLERKVFIPPQTHRIVLNGTENWSAYTSFYYISLSNRGTLNSAKNFVCSHFGREGENANYFYVKDNLLRAYVTNQFASLEEWKAYLANNSVLVEYATESVPEPVDISTYLTDDNFIEVEGGGVVRAVNDYNHDAPTTISFVSAIGG